MPDIPILTTEVPQQGNYNPVGVVSGHFSVGKGTVTDRILEGMNNCMQQIRVQAELMGGNEIFAARVNICEAGRHQGLVVVMITGTAVAVQGE